MGTGRRSRAVAVVAIALIAACGRLGFESFEQGGADDGGLPDDAGRLDDGGLPEDAATSDRDPALGDLLHYAFEDRVLQLAFDRSGNRLDPGYFAAPEPGKYGQAARFGGGMLFVPKVPRLLGREQLTFEAWLLRDGQSEQEWLLGDFGNSSRSSPPTFHFGLVPEGVELVTSVPCGEGIERRRVVSTETGVPAGAWTHLAVAWDGAEVRFYLNGELTETLPMDGGPPCAADNFDLTVGGVFVEQVDYLGLIDELKLSSYAKSAEEIQISMETPSGAARCGDGLIHPPTEACEAPDLCCVAESCATAPDGTACGDGGCDQGVCDLPGGAVTSDLIALYELDEGSGQTVGDSSGFGQPLDLTIADLTSVTWVSGGLQIEQPTTVGAGVAAQKILDAVADSGELTAEAWVTPANVTQDGPVRIATVAVDPGTGGFVLGQERGRFWGRVQTTGSFGEVGRPGIGSPEGDVDPALTHVVLTRSADGERRIYVDGALRSRSRLPGALAWPQTAELALANDPEGQRGWLGTVHRVALYDRALTASEVARNFAAGPAPPSG